MDRPDREPVAEIGLPVKIEVELRNIALDHVQFLIHARIAAECEVADGEQAGHAVRHMNTLRHMRMVADHQVRAPGFADLLIFFLHVGMFFLVLAAAVDGCHDHLAVGFFARVKAGPGFRLVLPFLALEGMIARIQAHETDLEVPDLADAVRVAVERRAAVSDALRLQSGEGLFHAFRAVVFGVVVGQIDDLHAARCQDLRVIRGAAEHQTGLRKAFFDVIRQHVFKIDEGNIVPAEQVVQPGKRICIAVFFDVCIVRICPRALFADALAGADQRVAGAVDGDHADVPTFRHSLRARGHQHGQTGQRQQQAY